MRQTQLPFTTFRFGVPDQTVDAWYRTIAKRHCGVEHRLFTDYRHGEDFSAAQHEFLDQYWQELVASSDYYWQQKRLDKVCVMEDPKGSGMWRSFRGGKNVTIGKPPPNGVSGGVKYEESYRFKLSKMPVKHRSNALLWVTQIMSCDQTEAQRLFGIGKQPSGKGGFFVHHGHSFWSGTDPSVLSILTPERIAEAKRAYNKPSKPKTEVQRDLDELLAWMPPLFPRHDRPGNVIDWLLAYSEKLILFQQRHTQSEKRQQMPIEGYAHYLWDNRHKFGSQETWPTVALPDGRECGREWRKQNDGWGGWTEAEATRWWNGEEPELDEWLERNQAKYESLQREKMPGLPSQQPLRSSDELEEAKRQMEALGVTITGH